MSDPRFLSLSNRLPRPHAYSLQIVLPSGVGPLPRLPRHPSSTSKHAVPRVGQAPGSSLLPSLPTKNPRWCRQL
ncbi:hypothetical protein BJV77DRAFT_530274 [Russula vinacea]|nr:hypothetical protein BJV77DRAFT_530274 [Russula vinacea]